MSCASLAGKWAVGPPQSLASTDRPPRFHTFLPQEPPAGAKGGVAPNPEGMLVLLLAWDMFSGIYSLPRMVWLSFPGFLVAWTAPCLTFCWEVPPNTHWPQRDTCPEEWAHNLTRNDTHCL